MPVLSGVRCFATSCNPNHFSVARQKGLASDPVIASPNKVRYGKTLAMTEIRTRRSYLMFLRVAINTLRLQKTTTSFLKEDSSPIHQFQPATNLSVLIGGG